jgi:hypothetical protein
MSTTRVLTDGWGRVFHEAESTKVEEYNPESPPIRSYASPYSSFEGSRSSSSCGTWYEQYNHDSYLELPPPPPPPIVDEKQEREWPSASEFQGISKRTMDTLAFLGTLKECRQNPIAARSSTRFSRDYHYDSRVLPVRAQESRPGVWKQPISRSERYQHPYARQRKYHCNRNDNSLDAVVPTSSSVALPRFVQ